MQATEKKFEENYIPTVGLELFRFNIRIMDKIINLQISDSSGEESYKPLIKSNLYPSTSLAIVLYSVDE